jgi:hypothetical protein
MAAVYAISDNTVYKSRLYVTSREPTEYRHSFGGPLQHEVIPFVHCEPPHLLFTLDLSDPNLEIEFADGRWLPLLYAFQYDASPIFYRILSDDKIEIVRQDNTNWTGDFPYSGFPREFPFHWARVGEPNVISDDDDPDTDLNDVIAMSARLVQGATNTRCINPGCTGLNMEILAVLSHDEVDDFSYWGRSGDAEEVVIVYEMCPKCDLVHATNQCT